MILDEVNSRAYNKEFVAKYNKEVTSPRCNILNYTVLVDKYIEYQASLLSNEEMENSEIYQQSLGSFGNPTNVKDHFIFVLYREYTNSTQRIISSTDLSSNNYISIVDNNYIIKKLQELSPKACNIDLVPLFKKLELVYEQKYILDLWDYSAYSQIYGPGPDNPNLIVPSISTPEDLRLMEEVGLKDKKDDFEKLELITEALNTDGKKHLYWPRLYNFTQDNDVFTIPFQIFGYYTETKILDKLFDIEDDNERIKFLEEKYKTFIEQVKKYNELSSKK